MLFFSFSWFFPAQAEVAEAIGVGRGFTAVVGLGCLRAPILQLGPYPLKIPRPGGAVL